MSRGLLLAAALGGLLMGLAAQAPLSLLARLPGVSFGPAFGAEAVAGSIWGGRLIDAHLGDWRLGDTRVGLQPLSLLLGAPRVSVRSEGPVSLSGAAALGGRRGVVNLDLVAPLPSRMAGEAGLSGDLVLEDVTVLLDRAACRTARGTVRIERIRLERAPQWTAPPLAGVFACAGEAAEARLQGSGEGVEMQVVARVAANGAVVLQTTVRTPAPEVEAALLASGFAPSPDGLVRSDQVTL